MAQKYYVLTGPTAAGKTDLLAQAGESGAQLLVISADSRQVYRHMDIGTGKPSIEQQRSLPHRVLDVVDPGEEFSAFRFVEYAADALRVAREMERTPWVCGGTGLYIRALTDRLRFAGAPRRRLRAALQIFLRDSAARDLAARLGLELSELDNPVRVLRAAENACEDAAVRERIYTAMGLETSEAEEDDAEARTHRLPNETVAELERWECAGVYVLDPGKDDLEERIRRRVAAMFASGLVYEVRRLQDLGFAGVEVIEEGIAYCEANAVLDGVMDIEQAEKRAAVRTRQYAKRQRTYFRGQGWPVASPDAIRAAISASWKMPPG